MIRCVPIVRNANSTAEAPSQPDVTAGSADLPQVYSKLYLNEERQALCQRQPDPAMRETMKEAENAEWDNEQSLSKVNDMLGKVAGSNEAEALKEQLKKNKYMDDEA